MYCKHCGSKLEENDSFCKYCGGKLIENSYQQTDLNNQTTQQNIQQIRQQDNPAQTLSVLGFVFSFIFAIVGLILSAIALKKYKLQTSQESRGLAVAGLVISIVSTAVYFLYFILIIGILII